MLGTQRPRQLWSLSIQGSSPVGKIDLSPDSDNQEWAGLGQGSLGVDLTWPGGQGGLLGGVVPNTTSHVNIGTMSLTITPQNTITCGQCSVGTC